LTPFKGMKELYRNLERIQEELEKEENGGRSCISALLNSSEEFANKMITLVLIFLLLVAGITVYMIILEQPRSISNGIRDSEHPRNLVSFDESTEIFQQDTTKPVEKQSTNIQTLKSTKDECTDLSMSARVNASFWKNRHLLNRETAFKRDLFPQSLVGMFGHKVTQSWGYKHIWKSGGTTIAKTLGPRARKFDEATRKELTRYFTMVRDPLDHYISGFQETIKRTIDKWGNFKPTEPLLNMTVPEAFKAFTERVLDHIVRDGEKAPRRPRCKVCHEGHSFPQTRFFFTNTREFLHEIQYVGHMYEMCAIFRKVIGREDLRIKKANVAMDDKVKKYWSIRIEEVDAETMEKVCKIIAVDYCVFGFDYPERCKAEVIDKVCVRLAE